MHNYLKTLEPGTDVYVRSYAGTDINDNPRIRKGGIAIIWKTSLSYAIWPPYGLGNDRVMAIQITRKDYKPVFVINVYMPSTNCSL